MAKGQIKQKQSKINKELFEELCNMQCTETEICNIFHICEDTLNSWCKNEYGQNFSDTYKIYSANGKMSLRRTQFRLAEKSSAMAIFLGKQYLGQTEKIEQKIDSQALNDMEEYLQSVKESNE